MANLLLAILRSSRRFYLLSGQSFRYIYDVVLVDLNSLTHVFLSLKIAAYPQDAIAKLMLIILRMSRSTK